MNKRFNEAIAAAKQIEKIRGEYLGTKCRYPDGNETRLREMMETLNPRFPTDSIDFDSICNVINGAYTFDSEEQEILESAIGGDDWSGDWEKKVKIDSSGVSAIIYWFFHKKSSGSYRLSFSGTNFPIAVEIDVFADMDDLRNHGEYCPTMLHEDDPEWSDDCNCQSYVIHTAKLIMKEDLNGLNDWITDNMFGCEDETPQSMGWVGSDGLP